MQEASADADAAVEPFGSDLPSIVEEVRQKNRRAFPSSKNNECLETTAYLRALNKLRRKLKKISVATQATSLAKKATTPHDEVRSTVTVSSLI